MLLRFNGSFFKPFVNNNERLRIHHSLHMDNAPAHTSVRRVVRILLTQHLASPV
jgi:hypothetical protein